MIKTYYEHIDLGLSQNDIIKLLTLIGEKVNEKLEKYIQDYSSLTQQEKEKLFELINPTLVGDIACQIRAMMSIDIYQSIQKRR